MGGEKKKQSDKNYLRRRNAARDKNKMIFIADRYRQKRSLTTRTYSGKGKKGNVRRRKDILTVRYFDMILIYANSIRRIPYLGPVCHNKVEPRERFPFAIRAVKNASACTGWWRNITHSNRFFFSIQIVFREMS